MRVLITGGAGHIGARIIEKSLFEDVVVVDNLSTQRFSTFFNLRGKPIRLIEKDARELQTSDLAKIGSVDALIHLAAITDASGTAHLGEQVIEHNSSATQRVIEICCELDIPLIFPSTTSVYGTQSDLVDEECTNLHPQSPYAESKLYEESLVQKFKGQGLKATILRLGTISGVSAGMRFHTAVNRFCWQAANGEMVTIWRTAMDQKRPYLSLLDFERAITHILENRIFDSSIYNVLTSNLTVRDIIMYIESALGHEIAITFVDSPIMNQLSYEVSSEKFRKLNFDFSGNIKSDIKATLDLLCGLKGYSLE
jgi:UDP-glucose 4-epimerase